MLRSYFNKLQIQLSKYYDINFWFSGFHKMTVTVLKTEYVKADPIQISYRNYTKFNPHTFSRRTKRLSVPRR